MKGCWDILLAEDREDDVILMRQAFAKAGVGSRLHVVCDGAEAKAYLEGNGEYRDRTAYPFPHLMLLDVNMPRVNGFEVLEWIRRQPGWSCLLVHMLSASIREADMVRAYEAGANSYAVKPSRMDELIGFVTALHDWHQFVRFAPEPRKSARAKQA